MFFQWSFCKSIPPNIFQNKVFNLLSYKSKYQSKCFWKKIELNMKSKSISSLEMLGRYESTVAFLTLSETFAFQFSFMFKITPQNFAFSLKDKLVPSILEGSISGTICFRAKWINSFSFLRNNSQCTVTTTIYHNI